MGETTDSAGRVMVKAYGQTDPGRVRTNNEDAFIVTRLAEAGSVVTSMPEGGEAAKPVSFEAGKDAVLLAVSDGMGGANAGEVASALVIESLRAAMMTAGGEWGEATKQAVERANKEVWNAAREPGKKGMGATLTAVCVHGDQAHIAEVGDSRAYLVRNGRIRQVTRDQSFVQLLIDSGALKPEEAEKYPLKNIVLQAMGQNPDVEVALGRLELRRADRLLLCSDGLSNKVSSKEMLEVVEQSTTLDEIGRALIKMANERGGDDNITVVLAEVDGEGLSIPREQETLTQTFQVLAEYRAAGQKSGLLEDEDASGPHPALPKPLSAAHSGGSAEEAPASEPDPKPSAEPAAPPRAASAPITSSTQAAQAKRGRDLDIILAVAVILLLVALAGYFMTKR